MPLATPGEAQAQPFEFSIAMGVRKGDEPLRAALDEALARKRGQVDRLLKQYGVPLVEPQ